MIRRILKRFSTEAEKCVTDQIPDTLIFNHMKRHVRCFPSEIPAFMEKVDKNKKYLMFFDGACKRNPGPSGVGIIFFDEDFNKIGKFGINTKFCTNNMAEYYSVMYGVWIARLAGIEKIQCYGDSMLVVNQIIGKYGVKNNKLRPIYRATKEFIKGFDEFEITHVSRNQNKHADKLANEGVVKYLQMKEIEEEMAENNCKED